MACGAGGGLAIGVGVAAVAAAVGATVSVGVGVPSPSVQATRATAGSSKMRSSRSVVDLLNSGIFSIIVLAVDVKPLGRLK